MSSATETELLDSIEKMLSSIQQKVDFMLRLRGIDPDDPTTWPKPDEDDLTRAVH